jgi:hypothetical protein
LQKCLLEKKEIEKRDIQSSVTTLVIILIMILLFMKKKTVLPKSIGGNLTFADVNTHIHKENELVEKEVIINYLKKEKID